jgi:hypothetical protein
MQEHQCYREAIDRLAVHGYEVIPDGLGYLVRRRDDREDISQARHLDDLMELAELFEWAHSALLASLPLGLLSKPSKPLRSVRRGTGNICRGRGAGS